MSRAFFLRLVASNLLAHRLRSTLVIGGIAASSAVIVLLLGVSGGLRGVVQQQARVGEPRDIITVHERSLRQVQLDQASLATIERVAGVGQIERSISAFGNADTNGHRSALALYGLSPDYFAISKTHAESGNLDALTGNRLVVSTRALEVLNLDTDDAIGKPVSLSINITKSQNPNQAEDVATIAPAQYVIAGVVRRDMPIAYAPLATFEAHGVTRVSELKIRVSSMSRVDAARESIEQLGFQTQNAGDTLKLIDSVFAVIQRAISVFTILVLIITITGTLTVVSLSLVEQTRQIGFLRVFGARSRDIQALFLAQSVVLTTAGVLAGLFCGLVGGTAVNAIAQSRSSDLGFRVVLFQYPVFRALLMVVLAVVVGWVIGVIPAKRAVMLRPLEELRA